MAYSITQQPLLTGGQRGNLDELMKILSEQLGRGVEPYPGQMVPGASQLQEQGFSMAGGLPGQFDRFQGMAEGALSDVLTPYDPASATEFWEKSYKQPGLETWRQDVIPSIKEHYASRDAADSGAMDRAIARSGKDLTSDMSAKLAELIYGGEQAHKGRQTVGIDQAGRVAGMPLAAIASLMGTGGTKRQIAGEELSEPYQKWASSQPYANPWLSYLSPGLNVRAFENIIEPSQMMMPTQGGGAGPGLMSALLPALGMAAGGFLSGPAFGAGGGGFGALF